MNTSKHVPQRSCVACRKVAPKRELVRIVAGLAGNKVDETGRARGRGAYLCPSGACWQAALKKDRLGHALRTGLTAAEIEDIGQYMNTL